jgi:hypothetical protein
MTFFFLMSVPSIIGQSIVEALVALKIGAKGQMWNLETDGSYSLWWYIANYSFYFMFKVRLIKELYGNQIGELFHSLPYNMIEFVLEDFEW